ncbi:MAG: hypothetical protein R2729_31560 [Bryobacteraceae bacterium]
MRWKVSAVGLAMAACLAGPGRAQTPSLTQVVFPATPGSVLYAVQGAAGGAPLRSDDGGRTWRALYVFEPGAGQGIWSLAVSPASAETIYAAATMDRGGVWRSTDSGATWTQASSGLPAGSARVESLTAALDAPDLLFARVGGNLYRTTDGGRNWTLRGALPGNATALGIGARAPYPMFTMAIGGAMFRSLDAGASWEPAAAIGPGGQREASTVVIDPSRANTVYVSSTVPRVATCAAPGGTVHITRDNGATWSVIWSSGLCNVTATVIADPTRPILHIRSGVVGRFYCRSTDLGGAFDCSDRASVLAVDPRNPDIVLANGGQRISRDAGLTFEASGWTVRPSLPALGTLRHQVAQGSSITQGVPVRTPEQVNYSVPFRATVEGAAWLTLPNAEGQTGRDFPVRISAGGLTAGVYTGRLRLDSMATTNPSVTIAVELTVTASVSSGVRFMRSIFAGGPGAGSQVVDNVPAVGARVGSPDFLSRDAAGNIYFYSIVDRRIRRIDAAGRLTTILGTGENADTPDGPVAGMPMSFANGMAADAQGRVYLGQIAGLRVIENGNIRTVLARDTRIGGNQFSTLGSVGSVAVDGEGRALFTGVPGLLRLRATGLPDVPFVPPQGVRIASLSVAPDGSIYFVDSLTHRAYRLRNGTLTSIAGTGTAGYNGDGRAADTAQLNRPEDVDADADGNVYIADSGNRRVRMIAPDGTIFTIAGGDGARSVESADATAVSISPRSIVVEPNGNLLVADTLAIVRLTRSAAPVREIRSGAMRNAASGAEELAPGALFSLFGANLADTQETAAAAPWPESLGGVSVLINGRAAPLFFASAGQINGQAPFETAPGTATVEVRGGGSATSAVDFQVAETAPGVLQFGANRAVAVNPDGTVNTAQNPVAAGAPLVVYFTGQGAVDNAVPTGAAAGGDPLSRPVAAYSATIGGQPAQVLFLGLAPGFVGLGQANLIVPAVPAGDHAVVLTVGGRASNGPSVTVAP